MKTVWPLIALTTAMSACAHQSDVIGRRASPVMTHEAVPLHIEMRRDLARAEAFFNNPRRSTRAHLPSGNWIPDVRIQPGSLLELTEQSTMRRGLYLGRGGDGALILRPNRDMATDSQPPWIAVVPERVEQIRMIRKTPWLLALTCGASLGAGLGYLGGSAASSKAIAAGWGSLFGLALGVTAGVLYEIDPVYDFGGADRLRRVRPWGRSTPRE